MSDQINMGLAEYLTFIRENLDVIYVRWAGKSIALADMPTDEALVLIHAWWATGHLPYVLVRNPIVE